MVLSYFFDIVLEEKSIISTERETSVFSMKVKPSPHPAGNLDEDS